MLRKATPQDLNRIVELGLEALKNSEFDTLLVCNDRMKTVLREAISSPRSFVTVTEDDGNVTGALCSLGHDCLVFERQQVTVFQFTARQCSDATEMLAALIAWANERRVIKMVVVSLYHRAYPEVIAALDDSELSRQMPLYLKIY